MHPGDVAKWTSDHVSHWLSTVFSLPAAVTTEFEEEMVLHLGHLARHHLQTAAHCAAVLWWPHADPSADLAPPHATERAQTAPSRALPCRTLNVQLHPSDRPVYTYTCEAASKRLAIHILYTACIDNLVLACGNRVIYVITNQRNFHSVE